MKTHIDEISHPGEKDENELRVMHAELSDRSDTIPNLDLHVFTKDDAIAEAEQFLSHQLFIGASCCRIVYGKGKGILERAVKKEIEKLAKQRKIQKSFPSQCYPDAAIVVVFSAVE
jgi:DNA-nicking Smr family endonuclease